ncbi:hypothetical protein METBIDRAFT_165171 [Metschnikowia bicuspidata var. bicuspidata NRRL YB-4993]|uniref:Uncharacterized protein n=1 Tax=Metschnikowia bicuspidata var. bicuspidata NRRL YB-4993 TaxID=869754 RepID=A0A1A0HAG6_9ASCO|nr:hypothetical protein METBIDRAFT_165171 [Metschnikowia bicuspidata var. bicuspidata NRRL YB-4993]OBA20868.1 hypothetical protein METBIDRAFT_165171 [Metschnikowia bicuspidata var. bicuspidata NRRL YB-4993]
MMVGNFWWFSSMSGACLSISIMGLGREMMSSVIGFQRAVFLQGRDLRMFWQLYSLIWLQVFFLENSKAPRKRAVLLVACLGTSPKWPGNISIMNQIRTHQLASHCFSEEENGLPAVEKLLPRNGPISSTIWERPDTAPSGDTQNMIIKLQLSIYIQRICCV